MRFSELKLVPQLVDAVAAEGYDRPTPIQAQAIPRLLEGRDLVGIAQTGTGKTAAFALPTLQRLSSVAPPRNPGQRPLRALVLTPTRELASQVGASFATYGANLRLRHTVIFGGVGQQPQVDTLNRGVDILVATPGRLLDLMGQKKVSLAKIEIFVLDEADRMLDMGFIHDVKRVIAALPQKRQTLLFSATMPDEIADLARKILVDPVRVEVTPQATTVEKIAQSVYHVNKSDKRALLEHLLQSNNIDRALVFTRTKHGANRLAEGLAKSGFTAAAIHGNKSQGARERALAGFKSGQLRVLVATDIAARGIDIDDLGHVVNFDLPEVPETYVHRIGRTARAGASGTAIAFCDGEERADLVAIERLIGIKVPVVDGHPYAGRAATPRPAAPPPSTKSGHGQRHQPSRHDHARPRHNNRNNSNVDQHRGAPSSGRPQKRRAPSLNDVMSFIKR